MTDKKFTLWHRIAALAAFVVSAVTYLLTIEPSASFWDCGEFIASSYKLEVGHPPGNPVFQLIARFFTMFGDNMHAAILVNAMSALCSALTIMLLYLTIVWLTKRIIKTDTVGGAIAVIGSGLVGAMAYCFSDTFWFSAVEGEVYAMSSLFTALVFWAMTMWYDRADKPHASRWIVLIAFLMGLSIGVHLLNLLAIPALFFMYYYRQREDSITHNNNAAYYIDKVDSAFQSYDSVLRNHCNELEKLFLWRWFRYSLNRLEMAQGTEFESYAQQKVASIMDEYWSDAKRLLPWHKSALLKTMWKHQRINSLVLSLNKRLKNIRH